jgi:hypothetical protein
MTQHDAYGTSKGFRQLGHIDIPGGGQVVVQGNYAYVGHLEPPHGTSILDISEPRNPKVVSHLKVPEGTHSHKVRVHGDVMLVNYERYGGPMKDGFQGGLKIFDVADRMAPREIAFYKAARTGVHRFDFDGQYAYFSPEVEGYLGNIVMILDLKDPTRPTEVSRWWLPGQWTAGGETSFWQGTRHRCHHPLRLGDRLYVSYWHGGFVILDISDLTAPRMVSHLDWSPPYPCPTHTALPIPQTIKGRKLLVVTDEEVSDRLTPEPNAFMWTVDITDETRPIPIATFRVPNDEPFNKEEWFGAHQPQEQVHGNTLFVTWFAGGLRAVDISDPYLSREIGYFMPNPGKGASIVQSNDIFLDRSNGRLYLLDRLSGLDILEFSG